MRIHVLTILACAVSVSTTSPRRGVAQTYAEHIVGGFSNPMFGAHAPGDANRLFVGRIYEGRIDVVDLATRTVLPTPFLDISNLLADPLHVEQGFLGLAFDPDYGTNGYFYVHYTGPGYTLNVQRFRVLGDPGTSNIADPDSGHTIFSLQKDSVFWHNSGWIDFGPNDGYLYFTAGDPGGLAQSTDNLQGKILRVDVRGDDFPEDAARNYAIPQTNPFVDKEGEDEIWAYGLRNPWRASFDRLTGDLWINDTGEHAREEVNFQPAASPGGENYGWPRREGSITGPPGHGGPPSPDYVDPIYDYDHNDPDPLYQGSVITGSGFYRGPVAALYGHYLFADFGSKNIWKLDPDAVDPRASVTNINSHLSADVGVLNKFASFGEDADGNLYVMDFDFGSNGDVFRIATASKDVVWKGDDAAAGAVGDAVSWGDANNWNRDGVDDTAFVVEDNVIFAAGSSQAVIDLGSDRTVAAITFQAPYRLENHTLRVLSGNVFVADGVMAAVGSTLSAETIDHSIRKLGLGTLLVDGNAGQIAVKEGTLGGSGTFDDLTVRDGAILAPGASTGIMSVNDSLTLYPGATLQLELNGVDNSDPLNPQHDELRVAGTAKLAGNLHITLFDDGENVFAPQDGDSFSILSAAEISGSFNEMVLPELTSGLVWEVDPADGSSLLIHATSDLRSDYNDNGTVDAADFVVWRTLAGQSDGDLDADGTGPNGAPDGLVNVWDYNFWRANFGKSVISTPGTRSTNVPEPTEVTLITVFALSMWMIRPRALIMARD